MTASKILRSSFKTIKCAVTVGTSSLLTPHCTDDFIKQYKGNYPVRQTNPEDTAAILFTTGSTGPAKGVVYRHRMFEAQVQQLMQYYGIEENEVELPAFPLFALFSPALGVTCVIPDMDPTRPAQVNPANIVEAVNTWQVTNTFGSPSIWRKVTEYCVREGIKLPSLRRVLMAGAPVPLEVLGRFTQILGPAGETHTPYGATETLPTTNACGSDILKPENVKKNREGRGTFVGQPLPGMQVKIIKIVDDVITNFDEKLLLPQGQIGEIIATGPVTTYNYFSLEKATKKAKIAEGETIWHRMGDTGYFDEDNNLWFCGRMAHRVITGEETLFTIPCETIFNNHSAIFRSALVGIGKKGQQEPVIIVEPHGKFWPETDKHKKELVAELLDLGQEKAHTKNIKKVLFCRELPTDIRHNAKIFREKLAKWAAEQGWKTTPGLRKYFFDF
jgi:acyl-coenzyme A synthetase/AMP-(fatty) acid ligase